MFRAYAKINIGLYILGRRPDGYHNIETVFHRIDVWDGISFEPSGEISVRSSSPEVPEDETNICHKAAQLLRTHLGIDEGVQVSIDKRIPVGAGLGGGSADAAVVLLELPRFWGREVEIATLRQLGLELGSDVPYFLGKGSAVAMGRGEVLEYFALDLPFAILLCNPRIHVATGWAYSRITHSAAGKPADLRMSLHEGIRDPRGLHRLLRNDFEPVVCAEYPAIAGLKHTMMEGGAVLSLMSGSGSSVFGFFPETHDAETVMHVFRQQGHLTFLTMPHFDV